MQVKGKNFLVPVDAQITSEAAVRAETIDVDTVLDQLPSGDRALNIVILDACRNNPFERRFRGASGGLAQIDAPGGTLIAYATAPGKVASDGEGANGLYTQELLKAITQPGLDIEKVFKRVRTQVASASGQAQIPWEASSLTGDFSFVKGGSAAPQPPSGDSFSLDDLAAKEAAAKAKWDGWQAGMKAAFDKTAAFQGRAEAKTAAWDRFLSSYARDNPYSGEDEALRADAERQKAAAVDVPAPVQVAAVTVPPVAGPLASGSRRAGEVFRDCADCPEMVVVPAGSFVMGSEDGNADEKPVHRVTIGRAFAAGKYEVTQGEWQAVMGANPSKFQGLRNPVEQVSWNDAQDFIRRLNAKVRSVVSVSTGGDGPYRLLTEAEWEYAARAGTTSKFSWGDGIGSGNANCDGCGSSWDNKRTVPVGSFRANGFGLHDPHGNVYEWVQDCFADSYVNAPSGESPAIGTNVCLRVLRGGSWYDVPWSLRSAVRLRSSADLRSSGLGFRLARTLP